MGNHMHVDARGLTSNQVDGVTVTLLPTGVELREGATVIEICASSCGRLMVAGRDGWNRRLEVENSPLVPSAYRPEDVLVFSSHLLCVSDRMGPSPPADLHLDAPPALIRRLRTWVPLLALVAEESRRARFAARAPWRELAAPADDPFACLVALVVLDGRQPREAGPLVAALYGGVLDVGMRRALVDDAVQHRLSIAADAASALTAPG